MGILDAILGIKPAPVHVVSMPKDYYIPAMAAGAEVTVSVFSHIPDMRRYMPLNFVEVYNPSTTSLGVRIESAGGEFFRVEPNSSRIIRCHFNNLIISNIGANALAANTAILTVQRV